MKLPFPKPLSGIPARARGRCGRAFTLIEMLIVMIIITLVVAIASPGLGRMKSSTKQSQMRAEVLAAMQANVVTMNTYRKPDADSGEPRLAGVTYGGTAVFFDKDNGLIRFANDNQMAVDGTVPANDPMHYMERQTFVQNGSTWGKKAYDFLKPSEPVRIKDGIGICGIIRDDHGTPNDPSDDTVKLVGMPFAVCCGADTYGLPIAPSVFADLKGNGTYQQVPTANPAVIVFLRDDVTNIGANPDDLSTLPGATDQAKVQTLLFKCKGQLVELSIQNGSEMDT